VERSGRDLAGTETTGCGAGAKGMTGRNWRKEESKIYLRDFFFWLIIVAFSIFISHFFILDEQASAVDRLFIYLLVFIPLGTLNLILHYFYRNRRIRQTGNLRSSLRYRLSIAFMFVSIIPSIPIFVISSNVVEKLVEDYMGLDVTGALKSARQVILYYEQSEMEKFLSTIKKEHPDYFRTLLVDEARKEKIRRDDMLNTESDYVAVLSDGAIVVESLPVFSKSALPEFKTGKEGIFYAFERKTQGDFLFTGFPVAQENSYIILGKRLHPGFENDFRRFNDIYAQIENKNDWKANVPGAFRLAMALLYMFMIASALVVSILIARQISFPIVSLAEATRAVTDGKIETKLDIKAKGEIGVLIESFNQMTEELLNLRHMQLHSQRMAAWQEVAKRLAHEIKNPLTPIQLNADRMLRRLDHPEKGELDRIVRTGASTIVAQVNLLKGMVEEFAMFARMPEARPVRQSLNTIVEEAVNLFSGPDDVTIEKRLEKNLPDILIDKNIIRGLLTNLIKNAVEAIRATESGRENNSILISTSLFRERRRDFVVLTVEDSGPGIDESLKDKIFEPYFSTKGAHGSGLGLALVERAILDHDARIYVGRSTLGGAEFRIVFKTSEEEDEDLHRG